MRNYGLVHRFFEKNVVICGDNICDNGRHEGTIVPNKSRRTRLKKGHWAFFMTHDMAIYLVY